IDFDHCNLRQRLSLHAAHQRRVRRIAARGKVHAPVCGIGVEYEARPALPLAHAKGPGPYRAGANVSAGGVDDFAGSRANETEEVTNDRVIRLDEPELQRIALERTQALDRTVVVELPALARCIDNGPHANDQVGRY